MICKVFFFNKISTFQQDDFTSKDEAQFGYSYIMNENLLAQAIIENFRWRRIGREIKNCKSIIYYHILFEETCLRKPLRYLTAKSNLLIHILRFFAEMQ